MRTLVTPAVQRHVFHKFCESGLIVEVEDEGNLRRISRCGGRVRIRVFIRLQIRSIIGRMLKLCLPPSSSGEQSETDYLTSLVF
jgi:hypothetical protein